jgi:hypothetical protein
MRNYPNSHRHPRRFHDFNVAVWLAGPCVLAMGLAAGCGSSDNPHTRSPDGGFDLLPSPPDQVNDRDQALPDSPLLDAPAEGLIAIDGGPPTPPLDSGLDQASLDGASDRPPSDGASLDGAIDRPPGDGAASDDGGSCQAPKVWRYQNAGCGADVHPVCGSSDQDAGVGFACGCDGETLRGYDYFKQPWSSRGVCPGACYSPNHNLDVADVAGQIKGCACNPATDATQCVSLLGWVHTIACVANKWQLDTSTTCTAVDAGTVVVDGSSGG